MSDYSKGIILGASLGNCVHVAGVLGFLKLAEERDYATVFLGPAISIRALVNAVIEHNPDIIALSYRLTPEVLKNLLEELQGQIAKNNWQNKKLIFGGTPPAAKVAEQSGMFSLVVSGAESTEKIFAFLEGKTERERRKEIPPQNLLERIQYAAPYPIIRHHFGQPTMEATIEGAKALALSETIDVFSIGPDQNAQESFFRPKEMKKEQDGAGGVPLRTADDLKTLYEITRCGNYPLLRCYSGTRDLVKWAEMSLETINIAWGAVPLFWYNQLDGRSDRAPADSIAENQEAMHWYGSRNIPLEVNEAHHWSLRDAPDSVAVAAAFLAAYNAKRAGVQHYVSQYMFNTPPRTSAAMDLAKMLAKIELIEALHDGSFTSIRQVRSGLASLDADPDIAKGQLSAATLYQLALEPQILHVVGFCEGDHAARPDDIIESVKIVRGVLKNHALGPLQLLGDEKIIARKEQLIEDANLILEAIKKIAKDECTDPWKDPATLAEAAKIGLLDAPHLCGNPFAAGKVFTQMREGACDSFDLNTGKRISEERRIAALLS